MQDVYCPEELHTLLVTEFTEKYGNHTPIATYLQPHPLTTLPNYTL